MASDSTDMSLSKLQEMVKDQEDWRFTMHRVIDRQITELLNNNNEKLLQVYKLWFANWRPRRAKGIIIF